MQRIPAVAGTLALAFASIVPPAAALVTQPNGSIMPVDSMNGEIQLYSLFASRGEPIDYQADGGTAPATFSPLCDFTAEFLLHEAGSSLSVGWYNVDPSASQPPDLAEIHVIVPAGSPVGTVITAADIKNHPSYLGGQIGFALVGAQTHYSEPQWNPLCSGCNPPNPWITAVIYPSVLTPNAYYLAFEDGPMGANPNEFNNDGDYNDYVYFFSGLTCDGGGEPCDTGLPGVCAPGVTQCTSAGIVCQGLTPAAPGEACDGLDNDCNGVTDEGDLCQAGYVCDKGTCVVACSDDEFVCPPSKVCDVTTGYCVDPACAGVACPAGEVCVEGDCRAPCDGVVCPHPTVCRVGACVDPCADVTCEQGQVCDGGVCKTSCACAPCAPGLACEAMSGLCLDPLCLGVRCDPGTHCVQGACVDSCDGAVCPTGQVCAEGACMDDPSAGQGGGATTGIGVGVGGGGTTGAGGAGGAGGGAAPGGGSGDEGGCGCRAAGAPGGPAGLGALAMAALALLGLRRRR